MQICSQFLTLFPLQENVDAHALVNCVMKNIGFHHGKPVAAFTIYKCLLHWKSFEAERTSVFDRLIQMIGSAIENQDDNDLMAYWLSNLSALLFLLQQSLKSGGAADATPVKKPPNPTSLFGRMTMGFRSSPSSANLPTPSLDIVRKVEAKYPALLFKQQLTAYVEKIYGILRDNLKKELASMLSLRIQEMGVISWKIPACGNMCVCCPALRSRSRQPVKRYRKLLADIFPKSPVPKPTKPRNCGPPFTIPKPTNKFYFFYGHRNPSQNRPTVRGGLFSNRQTLNPNPSQPKPTTKPFNIKNWDPHFLSNPNSNPSPSTLSSASLRLSPIARFIVDAFRRNDNKWCPNVAAELSKLRRITPNLVAEVLKVQTNHTLASKFFHWAGSQRGYHHNFASYNALAYCLNRHHQFRVADQLPELMESQGKPPSEKQFEILIRMHSDANRGLRVYHVYEKMRNKFGVKPRVFLYNRVMDALVRTGHLDLALSVYDDLKEDGLVEESVTFMVLVKGLCNCGRIDEMLEVLGRMRERLCKPDVFAYTALVKILVPAGNLDACLRVWEEMKRDRVVPDVKAYATMIVGLAKGGRVQEGYELFREMKGKGCLVDRVIYGALVEAFVAEGKVGLAFDLLKDLVSSGYRADLGIYICLIEGLCNLNRVQKAYKLFQLTVREGLEPDFLTVKPLLVAYAEANRMEEFCKLLEQMQKLGFPVIADLSKFFSVLVEKKGPIMALETFGQLKEKGHVSVEIYNIFMDSLHKIGEVKKALSLFDEMKGLSLKPDSFTYCTAILCLVDLGEIKEACACHNRIIEMSCIPSVAAYSSLTKGLCQIGEIDEAMLLVHDCLGNVSDGPLEFKYSLTIIHACKSNVAEKVIDVLNEMIEQGCSIDNVIYCSIISGMCKHGTIEEARKVFSNLRERNFLTESNTIVYDELLIDHMKKKTADLVLSSLKFFGLESKLKAKGLSFTVVSESFRSQGIVWFIAEFSHIFVDFDEIVRATLDNYEWSRQNEEADVRAEAHHNWVDEVIRCEGRGGSVIGNDNRSSCLIIQPRPEIKGPSLLTREEIEKPEIWAQICIQRMVELAKESTTMRRVLDPIFVYFDSRQHWAPQKGLAMIILSRMAYFMENSGNQRLILASVIHHLDHKNVMNDPQLKTCVIQVATSLAMQIRSESGLAEIGFVGVLCRHLRKSLQASSEFVGEQELNLNISLQNSIDDCLLEIANGVIDAQPLFDLMAINLENIPSGVVGRATIGSLIILARAVTLALSHLHSQEISQVEVQQQAPDLWVWKHEPNGHYSTRSVYNLLQGDSEDENQDGALHDLWMLKIPAKVSFFAWRLIRDRLPTKANLRRRQVELEDSMCPFCRNKEEDASHIFFDCKATQPLWWESQSWVQTLGVHSIIPRQHFMQHVNGRPGSKTYNRWKSWWIALTWSIWQQRNMVIFRNEPFNGAKLLEGALFLLWTWLRAKEKDFSIHFNQWSSNLIDGFPEALLVQLLKVMLHSDEEARVGAHLIFSILLFPSSFHTNEISSLRSRYLGQHNKRHSHAPSVSASASITALLEKLRRNRNTKAENHVNIVHDQERDIVAEDWKQGCGLKNSPNFYKLTSIIDKATGSPSLTDTEPYVMKLTEDQMAQLLSAFWIQANLPDNLPSNIEAVAHSFILTLIVLRIKVSSSQITGSVGVKKASKGDTIFFYNARNSPGQYDLSRINHLHSSFVPEDVPDAASEKDLGNEFFKQKKFKEARDCYSRSIALSPTAVAYANRAMANIKLRRQAYVLFQEAEDDCTEALNLDDRYIKAYSRRATARKELGKIKESMDDAEFALRLEPNNQETDILQKASGVLRSTVQGTQKVGKSEEKVNGDSIHPISHSTQKEIKARSRPQSQGDDGSKGGLSASNSLEQRNHRITKPEMKASVEQLASRAASRAMSEAAKNVTPPTTAYQFEVSWRAFSGDLALQARLLKAISPHELPKIFKNALSSTILIEIIKCLASLFTEDMDLVVSYLEHLTKVPRFDVIVMFVNLIDKLVTFCADIRKIWDEVFSGEATPIEYAEILDNLQSKFGLGHIIDGQLDPSLSDESPSERKITKLCEYAAKNPFRIPKIAKYLEERCYKELRYEHIKLVNIIAESFNKLLSICKVQIAYFAVDVLNVILELLSYSKDETIQTLGCQCLSKFIYCQMDATYTHNIEKLVPKVCMLSREHGEACEKRCLRASSLQCLSAMVWFMAEFSHIFVDFDEIVRATLDNYEWSRQNEEADVRAEAHHNWVDEVIRCEGRGGSVIGNDNRSSCLIIQPRPEIKGPSLLTGEEIEKPEIWAQICIQRMVELAKESTTMRRVLDPMFVYFDSRQHWAPQKGLAMIILSRMAYFMENSGNQRLILASVIHHLDHKNVMNDPQLKTCVIQVIDAQPLFDLMAINLENIPSGVVGRATIGSLIILARAVTLALSHLHSQQGFPEALLVQLLKVMLLSDVEARVGAHLIFSILLFPSSFHTNEISSLRSRYLGQHNKRHSHAPSVSASASITALLEKLRRNRNTKAENHVNIVHDQERDIVAEDWKQGCGLKNSPNFYKLTSIIDKATGSPSLTDTEPYVMKLTEDQMAQLLSAFWIQANLPDNLPSIDYARFSLKFSRPLSPSAPHVISIGQLMESLVKWQEQLSPLRPFRTTPWLASVNHSVTNGGGHAQLPRDPMKLPPASPFDNFLKAAGVFFVRFFFHFGFYIAFDRKRLTAVLKVTTLCPCKGLLCSIFFPFGFYIALDRKKVLTAVLKVTALCHARAFFANGGVEGDGVLPCKGLLCSVFFFRFGFYVALDGKKV
ncbi:Pentatricopeptide repeat-containing protein [Glycine soja]